MSCDGDYVYATLRDLSAEASVEETLRAFLLTASHDLRTPVNGMSCAAQLLAACPRLAGDAEAAALLRTVRAACALMAATLDNAMELRQLAAPRQGCIDVRAVLDEVVDTCRAGLARRFELVEEESLPAALWGDEAAVRQTMLNLAAACAHYAGPDGRCSAQLLLEPAADEAAAASVCAVLLRVRFEAQRAAPLSAAELAAAFVVHEGDGAGLAMHAARRLSRAAGGEATIASEQHGIVLCATLRLEATPSGLIDCDLLGELAQPPVEEDAAASDDAPDKLALTARMLEHLVRTSDEMFHTGSIGPGGDFRFQFASPAVRRIFGWEESDLLDENPMAFTHPDDVPRCVEVFTAALQALAATGAAHGAVAVQRRFRAADGSYRTVRTMGCITPTRWTLVCKDLSPQFGRDEALRRLLVCVSRRLREPAAAVLAAAERLVARVPEADVQLLRAMGASCRLLLCVLRNVLSARAADELEPPLTDAPFDPRAAAHDVIDVLRTLHGAALELDCTDSSLPGMVEGADRALFCHILMNIAGNACKFEAGGGVRVRMRWNGAAQQLVVSVTDHGAGVSDEDAARLFQPYEAAPAAQGGGAGLGLFVARRAARRMGGDVVLEPKAQHGGTTFTVLLPVRLPALPCDVGSPCPSPGTPPASAAWQCSRPSGDDDTGAAPEGLRCLLVDDHALNLRVVSRLLLRAGFGSVETAVDGADALRKLRAAFAAGAPPHCVLMDMCMPLMSGPEAAAEFRDWEVQRTTDALAAPTRLPIVAFTANVLREQHAECIAAGMDAVATKPLQRADVEALLRRAHAYAEQLSTRSCSSSRPAKRRSGTLLALV